MTHNLNLKKQQLPNLHHNYKEKHINEVNYVNDNSDLFNVQHIINYDNIVSNNNNNNINNRAVKDEIPLQPPPLVTEKSKIEILNKISYEKNSFLLWIVTPLAASFSVAVIIASLAGPLWLLTEEKIPNSNYNGTTNYNAKDDGVYLTKYTKSSLWVMCTTLGSEFRCSTIDYFPKDEYSPDPNDSTMAIPYAITKSTPFFLLSGIALIISYILLLIAMCSERHRIYFFTSGILFIISGLLMLIGLIMYISIFKAEIGFKLRPRSSLQPPLFTFKYGQSFFLYVVGFIITEFVGILNVFLYIRLQHIGYGTNTLCFGYYKKSVLVGINMNKTSPSHYRISVFGCKLHSIPCFNSLQEPSYFFDQRLPCKTHNHNLTNSLNELHSEPYSLLPYDIPSTSRACTRSVSTTTDIYNNQLPEKNLYQDCNCNTTIGSIKNQFNKNYNCNNKSKFSANASNVKDMQFLEFCKTVGQKEKSKDVYYIENDSMSINSNIYIIDPEEQCNNKYDYKQSLNRSLGNFEHKNAIYYRQSFDNTGNYKNIHRSAEHEKCLRYLSPSESKYYCQSQTLPRNFLKKNWDITNDSLITRRTSINELFVPNRSLENFTHSNKSYEHEKSKMLSTNKWSNEKLKSSTNYTLRTKSSHLPYDSHSDYDIFDLEKIENERRKSHACLFNIDYSNSYDFGKSTAV